MVVNNILINLANEYNKKYNIVHKLEIMKLAFIRKTPDGKYIVMSEKGKKLGTYSSRAQAEKRLKQIEYFKHIKKKKASSDQDFIDLTGLDNLSYSAVMRELRNQCDVNIVKEFLTIFKEIFDKLVLDGQENPADKAMPVTLILFNKKYNVELKND